MTITHYRHMIFPNRKSQVTLSCNSQVNKTTPDKMTILMVVKSVTIPVVIVRNVR